MQYKPGNWVTGFKRSPRAANVQNRDMGLFLNSSGKFEPIDDSWDNLHSGGLFISDDNKLYFRDETNKDIYINSPVDNQITIGATSGVGINTTPAETFHVVDTTSEGGVLIDNTATDGNPILAFGLSGTKTFTMGVDDGDSDKFKIFSGTAIDGTSEFVIDGSGNVGIGTSSPDVRIGQKLDIATSDDFGGISLSTWSTVATDAPVLDFKHSKSNTIGTQAALADDDNVGYIVWRGSDGDEFVDMAVIRADVDGTPGDDDMPGRLTFWTTADGAASATERMRIDSAGNVGIGVAPSVNLDIAARSGEAAGLQLTGSENEMAFINLISDEEDDNGDKWRIRAWTDHTFLIDSYGTGSAVTALKIDTTPDVTVSAGNLIIGTAGKGIDFSNQASPAAGMTAELLDRYEEGTFTPVIADASTGGNTGSGTVVGLYTRIGRVVNFTMIAQYIDTSGMTAGNVLYFRGLPFTSSSAISGFPQSALISTLTFSDDSVMGRVNANNTLIILQEMDSGAVWGSLTVAAISSGVSHVYIQGSYSV